MNRLPRPKPCILDQEQFRFPKENAITGRLLAEIWRLEDGIMVRCRMKDLRDGDIFLKLHQDGTCDPELNGYQVACGDAWWCPTAQEWGITGKFHQDYDPQITSFDT